MQKKYVISLSKSERQTCEETVKRLKGTNQKMRRAQILLQAGPIGETIKKLQRKIKAWYADVNKTQRGVDWQMKIDDARSKLKTVYPKIKL